MCNIEQPNWVRSHDPVLTESLLRFLRKRELEGKKMSSVDSSSFPTQIDDLSDKSDVYVNKVCLTVKTGLAHDCILSSPTVRMLDAPGAKITVDAKVLVLHRCPGFLINPGECLRRPDSQVYLLGCHAPEGHFGDAQVMRLPAPREEAPAGASIVPHEPCCTLWHQIGLESMTKHLARRFLRSACSAPEEEIARDIRQHTGDLYTSFSHDLEDKWFMNPYYPASGPLEMIPALRPFASLPLPDWLRLMSFRTPAELSRIIGRPFLYGYHMVDPDRELPEPARKLMFEEMILAEIF